jgi:bifunctional non-homologous end joining protein LigD
VRAKLAPYRKKRNFAVTAEPSDQSTASPSTALRFVVQKHASTRLHYDLRLEADGVFLSWAVTRGPSLNPGEKRLAIQVEDHPLAYGDFEGTIPKGEYGAGAVMIWDRGVWAPLETEDISRALHKGELKFVMNGAKLRGGFVLVRMKHDRSGGKQPVWLLIKHRDVYADEAGDVLEQDRSIASKRTMEAIAAGQGKAPTPFMLAEEKPNKPRAAPKRRTRA